MESELFGYEKGAFTGAMERKIGIFEMADKGTLFLDEIGDVSLGIQAKVMLMEYDWPGNIRELLNILERAAIVAETTIDVEHLPTIESNLKVEKGTFQIPEEGINLEEVEKNLILGALEKAVKCARFIA